MRVDERRCEHVRSRLLRARSSEMTPSVDRDGDAVAAGEPPFEHEAVRAAVAAEEASCDRRPLAHGAVRGQSRSWSTAIRTASPARTCSRISESGESATRPSISTPRLIGPGCITFWPGRTRSGVTPQRAAYSRRLGTIRRLHPLPLHPQHVDDVGVPRSRRCRSRSRSPAPRSRAGGASAGRRASCARRRARAPGSASGRRGCAGRRRRSRRGAPRAVRGRPAS